MLSDFSDAIIVLRKIMAQFSKVIHNIVLVKCLVCSAIM